MKVIAAATVLLGALSSVEGGKIVGGTPAEEGRYPWIVGLTNSMTSRFPFCGGTLIEPDVVLTAAHCPTPNYVWIGCTDMNKKEECDTINVVGSTRHPQYNSRTFSNDFRILRLAKESIHPPVPNVAGNDWEPVDQDGEATTIGWGTTRSGGSQSSDLLEVSVPLVTNEFCARAYSPTNVDDTMICAGSPEGGVDACQGDSGGPLIVKCDENNADVLIGVVSWGFGCADKRYPGVYGRVSTVIDSFIADHTSNLNKFPLSDGKCEGTGLPVSKPAEEFEVNLCIPWRIGCSALINKVPIF